MSDIIVPMKFLPDPPHLPTTPVDEAANVVFLIAVLAAVAFTVLYTIKARWYQTHAGRSVWAVFVGFTLLLADGYATRWIGHDYVLRDWLHAIPIVIIAGALIYQLCVLLVSLGRGGDQLLGQPIKDKPKTGPTPILPPSNKAM
jgi:hypothetical protein